MTGGLLPWLVAFSHGWWPSPMAGGLLPWLVAFFRDGWQPAVTEGSRWLPPCHGPGSSSTGGKSCTLGGPVTKASRLAPHTPYELCGTRSSSVRLGRAQASARTVRRTVRARPRSARGFQAQLEALNFQTTSNTQLPTTPNDFQRLPTTSDNFQQLPTTSSTQLPTTSSTELPTT